MNPSQQDFSPNTPQSIEYGDFQPVAYDFNVPDAESFKPQNVVTASPDEQQSPKKRRFQSLSAPVLAFDTEYQRAPNGEDNQVLCYSYTIGTDSENYCSGIIETASKQKEGRVSLKKLVRTAVQQGLEEKVLDGWPEELIVCAHFLRADITTLSDFFTDIKTKVQGVRKSVASLEDTYGIDIDEESTKRLSKYDVNVYDKNQKRRHVDIAFYDSMLHAPAGQGLDAVGALVGKQKLSIPAPYSIARMAEFQSEQPEQFRAYAIADAEISFLHMQRTITFVEDELDLSGLPFTIGGMATRTFIKGLRKAGRDPRKLFGYVPKVKQVWPKGNGTPRTVKGWVPDSPRRILESFATECYHGGRNECFLTGPTEIGDWYDYDAPSCYTVILSACRPLNYESFRMTQDLADFMGDVLGLARVRFSFPANTRFPSLPVRTERYGLFYPLAGESYCTAPEIRVALDMGCDIQILQGFVVPWREASRSIFKPFMKQVRSARQDFPAKSFEERLWKEIGNSLYGKLGQGLRDKTAFDVSNGISSPIKPSDITNPYLAAHVTGFARALMSEMLNGVPADKTVVSVTTDGFLTDAHLSEIDLTGPVCQRFRELYHGIDPDGGEVLECKHKVKQVIAMKTRGQLTGAEEPGYEPVIAKAGVQIPRDVADQHKYMLDLYLDRVPGQRIKQSTLTSSRKQMLRNQDMVMETSERRLNLEPDLKRMPVNPRMVAVAGREHIALDSVPHATAAIGIEHRLSMDNWRGNNVMKSLDDWYGFEEYAQMQSTARKLSTLRIKQGERADELMVRLFLRVFTQEALGVTKSLTYTAFGKFLARLGYPVKQSQIGSAKRAKLIVGAVPVIPKTVALLERLLTQFPTFEYLSFFDPDQVDRIEALRSGNAVNG
ncbi:DNA polymerase type B [Marinobacter segnicrescens]|uniref:DNA polymerase type B n=1 Tax=Marinobacter segnicrescens TaxID=430453 RepID=A0A1I0HRP3_9GAMM|nr:hypothetical protein [Marinobacter segnicrescens]SET86472.1 DNA polymerase type B [Marinobacter segnicrescens]